jgi:hypothetical protein
MAWVKSTPAKPHLRSSAFIGGSIAFCQIFQL